MRRVPTATASLGTAVSIILATLGSEFTRSSWLYSTLAAFGLVLGAGSALTQLRKGRGLSVFEGLAALGGVTVLAIGGVTFMARYTHSHELSLAALVGTVYIMPLAVATCFVGGLGQFPTTWIPNILACIAGPTATGFLALGPDTQTIRVVVVGTASFTIWACIISLAHLRSTARSISVRFSTAACIILLVTMLYAVYIAATPAENVLWSAPPIVLAWAYILAAACAAMAGFLYRKNKPSHTGHQ